MTEKMRQCLAGVLLALAVAFMLLGVLRGEAATVLGKAVTICMQCIGLG